MRKVSLEQFEGPLDLLLQLIEKNELDITEISLANVTDQYLDYIDKAENLASEEVADFLLIASKLVYIKSKHLLPDFDMADEEDAGSLEKQLKIYRQYYEASKMINKLFNDQGTFSYVHTAPLKLQQEGFVPPKNADTKTMKELFNEVLRRIDRIVNLPKVVIKKAISIGEKISHIKEMLKKQVKFKFSHILKDKNKTETIVSFLAMLELVKQREIMVSQDSMFGELNINARKVKEIDF